ncbi:MAG: response regulator transcription factor [Propionibacteriaceae bacterium]|nr:response regulator transcription factor [Propionibacteriaceae bacterium]
MAQLLVIGSKAGEVTPDKVLPALDLLPHEIIAVPADTQALTQAAKVDLIFLDCCTDLAGARTMARLLKSAGSTVPLILVVNESGLATISPEWGLSDFVMAVAGPAEIEARIKLLTAAVKDSLISASGITIDDVAYSATKDGKPLDLTYTEFELLKYLVQQPGRVFTREHLLADVWGYDYYGGTRTVDVHVRRLRAKLGPDHESLIGTVRNVGYRFAPNTDTDEE